MTDQKITVSLPGELAVFLDTIRFRGIERFGRQWTSLPASRGEVVEMLLWEAQARALAEEEGA